jgi:hypothetical protein
MKYWTSSALAILLASFPGIVRAQVDCDAIPAGPARTDCYIGLGRVYHGQSDVAAGNARVTRRVFSRRPEQEAVQKLQNIDEKQLPQLARNE